MSKVRSLRTYSKTQKTVEYSNIFSNDRNKIDSSLENQEESAATATADTKQTNRKKTTRGRAASAHVEPEKPETKVGKKAQQNNKRKEDEMNNESSEQETSQSNRRVLRRKREVSTSKPLKDSSIDESINEPDQPEPAQTKILPKRKARIEYKEAAASTATATAANNNKNKAKDVTNKSPKQKELKLFQLSTSNLDSAESSLVANTSGKKSNEFLAPLPPLPVSNTSAQASAASTRPGLRSSNLKRAQSSSSIKQQPELKPSKSASNIKISQMELVAAKILDTIDDKKDQINSMLILNNNKAKHKASTSTPSGARRRPLKISQDVSIISKS